MLNWSMADLSLAARVSVSVVSRAERDAPPLVSDEALGLLQDAFETNGIRFLADEGSGLGVQLQKI